MKKEPQEKTKKEKVQNKKIESKKEIKEKQDGEAENKKTEKEEKMNKGFFKKIWYSITKFEQYPVMAAEGIKTATRYLLILITLVTIVAMGGSLLQTNKLMKDLAQYIQENIHNYKIYLKK